MTIIFLRRFIALGTKTKDSSTRFGEGHNFIVEVGFAAQDSVHETRWSEQLDNVISRIDHHAIGVDVELGFNPVPSALAEWLFKELKRLGVDAVREVRLIRGDGPAVAYFAQP